MRTLLLAVVAAAVLALAAPALAQAPSPSPSPSASPPAAGGGVVGSVVGGLGNILSTVGQLPGAIVDLPGRISSGIVTTVGDSVSREARKNVDRSLGIARSAATTPDFADNGGVKAMWAWALVIINGGGLLVLLISLVGLGSMVPEITGWTLKVVGPRLILGWLLANVSLGFLWVATQVSNALTSLFVGWQPTGSGGLSMAGNAPWLLTAFAGVLSIVLVITTVVRIVMLVILAVAGPWAQITVATPQTGNIARVWWRMVIFLLASAPLQMLAVAAMVQALTDPSLLPGTGPLVAGAVLVVGLLVLTAIPSLLIYAAVKPAVRVVMGVKGIGGAVGSAASTAVGTAASLGPALARVASVAP